MSETKRKFAVFDIDGTLVRWQLYHAIVDELIEQGKLPQSVGDKIQLARDTWKRRVSHDSFKKYEYLLWQSYVQALTSLKVDDVEQAIEAVFNTYKDQVYTFTRDLITKLKAEGYLLFAVSGSHHEIVKRMGDYYGFDEVIGTKYIQRDGVYTGEEVAILHEKDAAVRRLVEKYGATMEDSVCVGDSESDIRMLEIVEQPIAFNPAQGLLDMARQRGWKIVVERKNVVYELEPNGGSYVLA